MKGAFDSYDKDSSTYLDKDEFKLFASDLLKIVVDVSGLSKYDILEGKNESDWYNAEFDVSNHCNLAANVVLSYVDACTFDGTILQLLFFGAFVCADARAAVV